MAEKKRSKTSYLIQKKEGSIERRYAVNLWSLINCQTGKIAISVFSLFFIPSITFAACSNKGASVVYINGIFTSLTQAENDLVSLKTQYKIRTKDSSIEFINGYNPTHVGGAADLVHAAAQTLDSSISTFDRNTILLQIHPQITTRKVVFVGHSQGSFYANELYDYLLDHGQPKAATGVYQVGSPASFVAGGGKYLTSSNDSIINAARRIASNVPEGLAPLAAKDNLPEYPTPMKSNITLSSTGNGHTFSSVYLAEAPERIVGDIQTTLQKLKPEAATEAGECFTAPSAGLGYQAAKAGYAAADAAATGIKVGFVGAQKLGAAVGDAFLAAAGGAFNVGKRMVQGIGGTAEVSKASANESLLEDFDMVSKFYGSSLSKEDVAELLGQQGSAVATAEVFNEPQGEVLGAEVEEEPIFSQVVKKIIYLGGGGRSRSSNNEFNEPEPIPAPEQATTTEPVATTTEPVIEPEPALPAIALREVVINELMWAGERHWLELRNASSSPIDLSLLHIVVGSAAPVQLSGTIEPGQYAVIERTAGSLLGVSSITTAAFDSLTTPAQVSLKLADGFVVDATPAADACSGWCAGGYSETGYADRSGNWVAISMERIEADEDGTAKSNWASSDGYTKNGKYSNNTEVIGTPGNANSSHWPLVGFFCGNDNTILEPRASADVYVPAGSNCTGLMGTVPFHLSVGGGIFKGTVGSSTSVATFNFPGRSTSWGNHKVGTTNFSLESGQYFVAFWEYNNGIVGSTVSRIGDMQRYFLTGLKEDGTPVTPRLTYHLIPFTLE